MRWTPLLMVGLLACSGADDDATPADPSPQTAEWLMTADWGWVAFNHRVSHLTLRSEPPEAAIIGGTSTTGVAQDLGPTCDSSTCIELPVRDKSDLTMVTGSISTTDAFFETGQIDVLASATGEMATLSVDAPAGAGDVVAILQGFSLDTSHPLDGPEACYDPAFGWHPTAIGVELLDPRREGGELQVDVRTTFGAGVTEDPQRACVDEVQALARVPFRVEVLFVVADGPILHEVHQEAYFPFSGDSFQPGEQTVPGPVTVPASADAMLGWSSLVYRFNPDSSVGRGAYLRTLTFGIEGTDARGSATNYSPITQLHDFGFEFDGVVVEVPIDGVTTNTYTAVLPADLDENLQAVVWDLTDPPETEE